MFEQRPHLFIFYFKIIYIYKTPRHRRFITNAVVKIFHRHSPNHPYFKHFCSVLPVTGITHFTFRRHTCSTCAVWHVWVCVVPLLCGTPWFVPAVHVKTQGLFLTHRTTPWPEECRGAHGWLGWTWTESPLRRGCTCCMALYIIRSLPPWAITSFNSFPHCQQSWTIFVFFCFFTKY